LEEQLIVSEIMSYLQMDQWHLEKQLIEKEDAYKKIKASFSELSLVPLWRQPIKPLLQFLFRKRTEKIRREIPRLRKKINKHVQARVDSEQGTLKTSFQVYTIVKPIDRSEG